MTVAASTVAILAGLIWVYLAVARGGFWRGRETEGALHAALARRDPTAPWPSVTAVIPARDEAEHVGSTVRSLLAQDYRGRLDVVVVDDHSADGTAAVARDAARELGALDRLTVLAAPALPPDWTGKLSAVAHGVAHAESSSDPSPLLLLTDADIRYGPATVSALVSSAIENRLVLSSLMVQLRCASLAEHALIPAFVFFFQMLYPFAWVNQRERRTAAAAGGCMLVDRLVLREAGGVAAIRNALIDDCALARLMKARGPIALALGERVESLRPYPSFGDIRRMVVRSAYAQLQNSWWRLAVVVAAMAVVFIAPPVLAFVGDGLVRGVALATWALMTILFLPMVRRYRIAPWWALGLPLIAAAYLAFTIESAWQHLRGRGGMWKGRVAARAAETS